MNNLILYHGSQNKDVFPQFGLGDDKHDYGRGFYLTSNLELAKEWAVCVPSATRGWVHTYSLDIEGLKIVDFQKKGSLAWLAELMKHREVQDLKRYKALAKRFIEKYGINTEEYDVIEGWQANASYFYIAKEFVRDNIDIDILEKLLCLGNLGIQYCIKTELAFSHLKEDKKSLIEVDYSEYNSKYTTRDFEARIKIKELINSEENRVEKVFSTLI